MSEPAVATEDELAEMPARGTQIDRFLVTAPLSEGKHATVVQARDDDGSFVALKLAKTKVGAELLDREGRLLGTLGAGASPAPRFVGAGSADGRPYCAARWVRGAEVRAVAAELCDQGPPM